MSSTMRDDIRSSGEASCNGIVRRMVRLPRSLIGGFSRAMGHGRGRIGIGGRRTQNLPSNFQMQNTEEPLIVPEAFAFLHGFEQHYGTMHPFFYACQFMEALKIAKDEHKFLFMYLHSPEHPFTPSFCRETLSSELVVQFLDANFVSWAALTDREEGLQMAATLNPSCFPFCAIIAPAHSDSIAVLQKMEGPISPTELMGILQRTVEEQGLAFHSQKAKQAEQNQKMIADHRLRDEQDAAYLAALQIDKEKEKLKSSALAERIQKPVQVPKKANSEKLENHSNKKNNGKMKEASATRDSQYKEVANRGKDPQAAQILIRFPNGERREQCFLCTDKVQAIYRHIDSLGLPGIGNYRLISSFPRRVYGVDQMGMMLKDAGLHPRASLFLELL
ncbi:putative UBX domain-containing protein 2/7 [Rosa chinensis]|uniref:Putative UBX domain-containing protein 2/7 n=1 Tax=Rosa chinensis TaxID=74649 RepID=A0A2P6P5T6_ROSCH|nr:plant UBX domain-containing protein 10 [Rosa chinensis]PRQ17264.1 putative UBX domain-containing protein 2/7 [Rosa chinensis]